MSPLGKLTPEQVFSGSLHIGGTISELTSGKFANGAMSGAIRGAMMKRKSDINQSGRRERGDPVAAQKAVSDVSRAMLQSGSYRSYGTEMEAHEEFQLIVRKVDPEVEVGIKIGRVAGADGYLLGVAYSIVSRTSVTGILSDGYLSGGLELVAISHFHPGGNAYLSGTGIGYRYNDFSDGVIYQAWNRAGDGNSAHWNEINVYSFSISDYDYFNYGEYRGVQLSRGGAVPICFSTRLGCP